MDRPVIAGQGLQHEPGDTVIIGTGRAECRLVGLIGITTDLIEPVGNQQQGAVHVCGDIELQLNRTATGFGTAAHF